MIPKLLQVCIYSAFYFVTLEEYYSGFMYFPPFNGISDGSVGIIALSFYTWHKGGSNFWATPCVDGRWLNFEGVEVLTMGQVLALFIAGSCFLYAHYQVIKICWYKWYPRKTQSEKVSLSALAQQYVTFWLWTAMWFYF